MEVCSSLIPHDHRQRQTSACPNQLAKWIVDQSTSGESAPEILKRIDIASPANISRYMAAIGRKGGQIGEKATQM